ncbi:MAG: TIGR01212 family radical SAM protein [Deltaproteobacteria bacterium]|nr:TIGR01212 family radical SAM protein [Deltaproteobacteria bacterium]
MNRPVGFGEIEHATKGGKAILPRYRALSAYMKARHGKRVQRLLVRGGFSCPNRNGTIGTGGCAFCDYSSTFTDYTMGLSAVTAQLEASAEVAARRFKSASYMAYFHDGTATYAPIERLESLYNEALAFPGIVALAIGTRPDCLGKDVLDLLEDVSRRTDLWLELGLQTASDRTLHDLGRGHDVACFSRAVANAHERKIKICAHVILGLPGEGTVEARATAKLLNQVQADGVKIHNFHVLKGARWAEDYMRNKIIPPTLEEYTRLAVGFLEVLNSGTVVHRLSGYANQEHLLAPSWTSNRWLGPQSIRKALTKKDTWQGKALGSSRASLVYTAAT